MPHLSTTDILLACVIGLLVIVAAAQLLLFRRKDGVGLLRDAFESFQESSTQAENALRGELAQTLADVRALREEMATRVTSLLRSMMASTVTKSIDHKLEQVRLALEQRLAALQEESGQKLDQAGENTAAIAAGQREEVAAALTDIKESLVAALDHYTQYLNGQIAQSLAENAGNQKAQIAAIVKQLSELVEKAEHKLESYRVETDARLKRIQAENAVVAKFSMATRAFGATLANEFDPATGGNGRVDAPNPDLSTVETQRSQRRQEVKGS